MRVDLLIQGECRVGKKKAEDWTAGDIRIPGTGRAMRKGDRRSACRCMELIRKLVLKKLAERTSLSTHHCQAERAGSQEWQLYFVSCVGSSGPS